MSSSPTIADSTLRRRIAAVLLLGGVLAGSELQAAPRPLRAQGRILGPGGGGQGGWPVEVIATQRYVELKSFRSGGEVAVIGRTVSDAQGYFSFDLQRERGYQFWFLRFSGPAVEDPIQWSLPEDLEITHEVRRGRVASVNVQLTQRAEWPEVQRRVALEGGESTPRGRILRTLGLPEKEGRGPEDGGEEWWYFTRGVMYTFATGGPALHRFEPVLPPGAQQARKEP